MGNLEVATSEIVTVKSPLGKYLTPYNGINCIPGMTEMPGS